MAAAAELGVRPRRRVVVPFEVGDRVVRNPATWLPNAFDSWGRGVGVGVVVEPPFPLGPDEVDVRWPGGRCFESVGQLLPAVVRAEPVAAADPPRPSASETRSYHGGPGS